MALTSTRYKGASTSYKDAATSTDEQIRTEVLNKPASGPTLTWEQVSEDLPSRALCKRLFDLFLSEVGVTQTFIKVI